MTQITNLWINGHKYHIKQSITLFQLIEYLNYDTSLLVLEYNNKICNKNSWKTTFLNNHDTLEIVTIVGGG